MPSQKKHKLTFIDLFCGIGGFHLGMLQNHFSCVLSSEIDEHAKLIYEANFGLKPNDDIKKIIPEELPIFDVLCGGFPCQSFSIAGKQKGFEDTRGTLFFDICKIIKAKNPKVVFLENVKNLEVHDKGNTLKVIVKSLNDLGYAVEYKVLNAIHFGVPQNRQRIIIVANNMGKKFNFEKIIEHPSVKLSSFLEKNVKHTYLKESEFTLLEKTTEQDSGLIFCGYLNKNTRGKLKFINKNLSRVHRQCNRIYSMEGTHPTLSSQEVAGRYYIHDGVGVRKLTLNECYKIMGFPDDFVKIGKPSQLYRRIGNSICVNMVDAVAYQIKKQLLN